MSDPKHPVWSLSVGAGQLLLMPCPGTKEVALDASLTQLKEAGATTVITLMTSEELTEQGVADIGIKAAQIGLHWMQLPIEDAEVPDETFEADWQGYKDDLNQRLQSGEGIAIHCKGGAGRTGLIAARLMLDQGQSLEDIIPAIQALRPRAFYFQAQRDYITAIANR